MIRSIINQHKQKILTGSVLLVLLIRLFLGLISSPHFLVNLGYLHIAQVSLNRPFSQVEAMSSRLQVMAHSDARTLRLLGEYLLLVGEQDAAMNAFRKLANENHHPLAYFRLGQIAEMRGDLTDAINYYRNIPQVAVRLFSEGRTAYESDRLDIAQTKFESVTRIDPAVGPSHYYLGATLVRQGHWEEAKTALGEAIDEDNFESRLQAAQAHWLLGRVLEREEDLNGALAEYKTATQINPALLDAYWRIAMIHTRNSDLGGAEFVLKQAIAINSGDIDFALLLPELYIQQQDSGTAINLLKDLIGQYPLDPRPYALLGRVLYNLREYKEAKYWLEKAVALESEADSYTHFYLGSALLALGSPTAAIIHLQIAVDTGVLNPWFHQALARTHLALGDQDSAREELNRALALDKDFTPALELLDSLQP